MEKLDVESRIRRLLTTRVGIAPEEVKLPARLIDDLGFDSLDAVELTIAMEREFNVAINEEQIKELLTVADIVDLVSRLADEQAGPG